MEAAAGHALSEEGLGLADTLFRETDGNPFFVTELLRHLSETGAIRQDSSGQWVVEHAGRRVLPESVREVVGGRVARLGHAAAQVLVTAAVIGRDFDLELLECATRVPVDDLLDILEAAETGGVGARGARPPRPLQLPPRPDPAHAARGAGPDAPRPRPPARGRGARGALRWGAGSRVGELAHHWIEATKPTTLPKAIRYSKEAGDTACARSRRTTPSTTTPRRSSSP